MNLNFLIIGLNLDLRNIRFSAFKNVGFPFSVSLYLFSVLKNKNSLKFNRVSKIETDFD